LEKIPTTTGISIITVINLVIFTAGSHIQSDLQFANEHNSSQSQ